MQSICVFFFSNIDRMVITGLLYCSCTVFILIQYLCCACSRAINRILFASPVSFYFHFCHKLSVHRKRLLCAILFVFLPAFFFSSFLAPSLRLYIKSGRIKIHYFEQWRNPTCLFNTVCVRACVFVVLVLFFCFFFFFFLLIFFGPNPRVSRAPFIYLFVNIVNAFTHPLGSIKFVRCVFAVCSFDCMHTYIRLMWICAREFEPKVYERRRDRMRSQFSGIVDKIDSMSTSWTRSAFMEHSIENDLCR